MKTTKTIRQSAFAASVSACLSRSAAVALLVGLLVVPAVAGAAELEWIFRPAESGEATNPPLPPLPIHLIIDDDTVEGDFGVGFQTAQQFLWFNRFSNPGPFQLEEIWVLFPSGANMAVGADVQLVVFLDPDGDPSNGATLLATYDEVIQTVDLNTFSVYTLSPALTISETGDILIGVVDRFVESGVTTPTTPAAIDTTASQGRSWLAVWSADPPDPPALPPDAIYSLVDVYLPGNWMIRAFGTPFDQPPVPAVPTVDPLGAALLVVLMAAVGWLVVRSVR